MDWITAIVEFDLTADTITKIVIAVLSALLFIVTKIAYNQHKAKADLVDDQIKELRKLFDTKIKELKKMQSENKIIIAQNNKDISQLQEKNRSQSQVIKSCIQMFNDGLDSVKEINRQNYEALLSALNDKVELAVIKERK